MTAQDSAPDALDQLFAILVRTVRDQRPEYLASTFDVSELLGFVPYKTVRTMIGADTNDDYGHTVTRLLAGEKGLLFVDDLMQDDLLAELQSKNPDLQAYRSYLNSKVKLAQERVRLVLDAAGPAPLREAQTAPAAPVAPAAPAAPSVSAAPPAPPAPPAHPAVDAPIAAPKPAAAVPKPATVAKPVAPAASAAPKPPAAAASAAPRPPAPAPAAPKKPAGTRDLSIVMRPRAVPDATASVSAGMDARSARPGCKYCGQPLPQSRDIRFCPHCGQDLSVHRCAACSAELEPGWKFCVSCGRSASG